MGGPATPTDGSLRVGIVGAGTISAQYGQSLRRLPQLRVTAVSDLSTERAAPLAPGRPSR